MTNTIALAAAVTGLSSAASSYSTLVATWSALLQETAAPQARDIDAIQPVATNSPGDFSLGQRALTPTQAIAAAETIARVLVSLIRNVLKTLLHEAFSAGRVTLKALAALGELLGSAAVMDGLIYAEDFSQPPQQDISPVYSCRVWQT